MTLEGKEIVFTRITRGELEGASSKRGKTIGPSTRMTGSFTRPTKAGKNRFR